MDEQMEQKMKSQFHVGVVIMLLLGAATIGEYGIAVVGRQLGSVLMLVALFKAFLVIRDYMHIGKLFSDGEEH